MLTHLEYSGTPGIADRLDATVKVDLMLAIYNAGDMERRNCKAGYLFSYGRKWRVCL